MPGFESAFLVDEGRSPLIGNAPLVPVGLIIDQGIDDRVDQCNLCETFLSFGFLHDLRKFPIGRCAFVEARLAFCQFGQLRQNIGLDLSPSILVHSVGRRKFHHIEWMTRQAVGRPQLDGARLCR
jgi:hypothetical protein